MQDVLKLERQLTRELKEDDVAARNRVHELVTNFLKNEAVRLTGATVRDEQKILDLLRLYTRTELLKRLIDSPKSFTSRELRDLFVSLRPAGSSERVDPISLIDQLNISDHDKKDLVRLMARAVIAGREAPQVGQGG